MSEVEYEIWQDGVRVVSVIDSDDARARREIMHYVAQYMQDGPLQIRGPNVGLIFEQLTKLSNSTSEQTSGGEQ